MSLLSSLQVANNALTAAQLGLQTTGNNIANANTPGYIRQQLLQTPSPPQKVGGVAVGLGVDVVAVVQQVDRFLQQRLRSATSDLENGQKQVDTYDSLEALLSELGDTDLSTSLGNFFNSIQDILNQPEDRSLRNLTRLLGETLTGDIQRLDANVRTLRSQVNDEVIAAADEINSLLSDIAALNKQIVTIDGGGTSASDAVGLRDQRDVALGKLASLIDIRVFEQATGDVSIYSGGDYLVLQGNFREVSAVITPEEGLGKAEIRITATDSAVESTSGKLAGLLTSRDEILGGFLTQLNDFSRTLIYEFNRVYSSGQGRTGYSELTSEHSVLDTAAPLDAAGLAFAPHNGSFSVLVRNKQTGLTSTHDLFVRLEGLPGDSSLESIAAELNGIEGISAAITADRKLQIKADSANVEFAFADDTSGLLASLGVNTFFSGTGASDIGISEVVRKDPLKFAASNAGIDGGSGNAVRLAEFFDTKLASASGASIADLYQQLVAGVTQGAAITRAATDGFRSYQQTLEGQHLAISGVSLDEEAIKMISYQSAFQAAARFVSTIRELLEILTAL